MFDRPNKPTALVATPGLQPQSQVNFSHDNSRVSAVLPTGESVEILLHGATIISWKDKHGNEKLWLSDAAKLDGSKAVRGGIPLVFPVFGTAPNHPQTSKLPQHGFARNSRWEFLGTSTSEGAVEDGESGPINSGGSADLSVKLDFGLGQAGVDEETREAWPFAFGLQYSVTLNRDNLTTNLVVTNADDKSLDVQVLMHTYLRVTDITKVTISGLQGASYMDKVDGAAVKTQSSDVTITGETDRVYTQDPSTPITVAEDGKAVFSLVRDNLANVVVWNPWTAKAAAMDDFEPKDGYKNLICVEAGAVASWQTLEAGDALEAGQTISLA